MGIKLRNHNYECSEFFILMIMEWVVYCTMANLGLARVTRQRFQILL